MIARGRMSPWPKCSVCGADALRDVETRTFYCPSGLDDHDGVSALQLARQKRFAISCPDRAGCPNEYGIGYGATADKAREHAFAMLWNHLEEDHGAIRAGHPGAKAFDGAEEAPARPPGPLQLAWWREHMEVPRLLYAAALLVIGWEAVESIAFLARLAGWL